MSGHIRNVIPMLIFWFIWLARNDSRFNNIRMNHLAIINRIKEKVFALFSANLITYKNFSNVFSTAEEFGIYNLGSLHSSGSRWSNWAAPNPLCFKINIHLDLYGDKWCIGGVIRDSVGNYIAGFAGDSKALDELRGFLVAVNHGLSVCINLDLYNVMVESNFLVDPTMFLVHDGTSCGHPSFYLRRHNMGLREVLNCSFNVINVEVNSVARALSLFGSSFNAVVDLNFDLLPANIQGLFFLG
ncbi:uncharacterized protein LOC114580215 [Dendrobium catenatum]|uniref:uncharacterized protein LOC114580215 n=1 Tax=Dendrobium catenatum TaxID=906689 RepID=UPI00109FE9A7|nr:uncharacterized protein LOC114580215 [Dendrobium catenatum]